MQPLMVMLENKLFISLANQIETVSAKGLEVDAM